MGLVGRLTEDLGLDQTGSVSPARSRAYVAEQDDQLCTVPDGHATGSDTAVDVHGQCVWLDVPPERIDVRESDRNRAPLPPAHGR
ncbi:MAG: hypothetical protein ACXV3S_08685, partial [Kineosporiaceae bacterium]